MARPDLVEIAEHAREELAHVRAASSAGAILGDGVMVIPAKSREVYRAGPFIFLSRAA
jgi:hypothetical protein